MLLVRRARRSDARGVCLVRSCTQDGSFQTSQVCIPALTESTARLLL